MKICMIGTGYVGLVSGACFADLGNDVFCVDKNKEKINILNDNKIPIYEPGLKELVNKNFDSGRLKFTTDLDLAVKSSDIIFICVGTPTSKKKMPPTYLLFLMLPNKLQVALIILKLLLPSLLYQLLLVTK